MCATGKQKITLYSTLITRFTSHPPYQGLLFKNFSPKTLSYRYSIQTESIDDCNKAQNLHTHN